jgi:uncharacterized protein
MSQAAKAQEPSMEEILASIRRIIADDETAKPTAKAPEPTAMPSRPAPTPVRSLSAIEYGPEPVSSSSHPESGAMSQDDIDAMLAGFGNATEESAEADTNDDVLELRSTMEARSEQEPTGFHHIDPDTGVVFTDPAPRASELPRRQMAAYPPPPEERQTREEPLLSQQATAAVSSAFGTLAHTVLMQNARTLDDLVREMLQPMLKTWLDDNLPTIVERLVRAEIERVSRGGA